VQLQKYFIAALSVLLAFVSWILFRIERNVQFGSTSLAVKVDSDNRLPCSQGITPSIDNIEDYDWIYCTSDLGPFWTSLNIAENEFTYSSSVYEAASTFGDLDRDGSDERILRLTLGTTMIRFVILKHVATNSRVNWQTLAHLDMPIFHFAPEARVVSNGRASWLAISYDEQSWGTGVLQENETWYELTNGTLIRSISFPHEVHEVWVSRPTIDRQVKSNISMAPFDGLTDRVDVELETEFGFVSDNDFTLTARRKVSFAKDPASQQFQFDTANSDISESTYHAVCDLRNNAFTYDVLVDFAYEEFTKLASGTDEQRRRVRELLPELSGTKHAQELVRLLSQK